MSNSHIASQYLIKIEDIISSLTRERTNIRVPIIFIFDCCRTPLQSDGSRSMTRGSGGIQALSNHGGTVNIYVMYSTASGHVASDGSSSSKNGAYTEYLLKHLVNMNTIYELSVAVRRDLFNDKRYKNMQVRPQPSAHLKNSAVWTDALISFIQPYADCLYFWEPAQPL